MSLLEIGSQLLSEQLGDSVDVTQIPAALSGLVGDADGDLDIGTLVSNFASSGGLGDIVSSWLGDGDNSPVSAEQISAMFGEEKIQGFADQLGIDSDNALGALSNTLPGLIDQSSSGGSLLDSVGGIGGVLDFAKKFF